MSEYPRNKTNITFAWLSSLYNSLISNPFPPLLNRQPSFFMIQRPYLYTYIGLTSSYTIHAYVLFIYLYYNYFILVYYTSILYYTLIKMCMIQPPILHLPCFHLTVCMTVNFSRYRASSSF